MLKDNIDTADKMPSTAGSRALKDSYPEEDSFVAGQLRKAGPMERSVADAALVLVVLTGLDSADEKTLDSKGRFYLDYTRF